MLHSFLPHSPSAAPDSASVSQSSQPSLLLSLRISSFLCHFVFRLISAPPSSTSSALSLSIPSLLPHPPPSAVGRLNEIAGVDKMCNLVRAGLRGNSGNQGRRTEPDKQVTPYKHMESRDTKRGREIKRT